MSTFTKALCVVILMMGVATQVEAGRTGGPATVTGTIDGGTSFWFDVQLDEGRALIGASSSDANGPLGLTVYDGDGRMFASSGNNRQRLAVVNVIRAGNFRVEVRNN